MKRLVLFCAVSCALAVVLMHNPVFARANGQGGNGYSLDLRDTAVVRAAAGAVDELPDGTPVLRFHQFFGKQNDLREFELPLDQFRGHRIRLKADVEAQDVSEKPQPWNGIKLMLRIVTPAQTLWPQVRVSSGSFDWRTVSGVLPVPADATRVSLIIGLEQVSGTARLHNISLSPLSSALPIAMADPNQPIFTGRGANGLRGAMVSPQTMKRADFDVLSRDWGANLARWQLIRSRNDPKDFPSYDRWLEERLEELDRGLAWATENGVNVVVDLHSPPGGGDSVSGYQDASGGLFSSRQAQDHFVAVWQKIAARYRGNQTIWGFDLANEPIDTDTAEDCLDWSGLALRAGKAIRAIDAERTLIVESPDVGSAQGMGWLRPLPLERVVYSFHMYQPGAFTHQGIFSPSAPIAFPGMIDGTYWDRAALKRAMQAAIDFAQKYRVHIYVGEFGAIRWAPGAERYLGDLISIFEEQGWDWSFHAFREGNVWSPEWDNDPDSKQESRTETARLKLFKEAYMRNRRDRQRSGIDH